MEKIAPSDISITVTGGQIPPWQLTLTGCPAAKQLEIRQMILRFVSLVSDATAGWTGHATLKDS